MRKKFYIAVVNREYKGVDREWDIVSPVCTSQKDAEKFLNKEYESIFQKSSVSEENWDIVKEDETFSLISRNYNFWGWVHEIECEYEEEHRFAYTILSVAEVDDDDNSGELHIELVFTDEQSNIYDVDKAVDAIIEDFKVNNPSDDYEVNKYDDWQAYVDFENNDIEGELHIWYEIHDVI